MSRMSLRAAHQSGCYFFSALFLSLTLEASRHSLHELTRNCGSKPSLLFRKSSWLPTVCCSLSLSGHSLPHSSSFPPGNTYYAIWTVECCSRASTQWRNTTLVWRIDSLRLRGRWVVSFVLQPLDFRSDDFRSTSYGTDWASLLALWRWTKGKAIFVPNVTP
jgi:hypothetical protein